MDIESEIWTYAGTGTKVHAFVDGVALCRKNLRNDPARVERMGLSYSGAVHYASVCRNCQFKFNAELEREEAYQARLAASMAPSTGEGDHLPPAAEVTEVQDEVVIVAEQEATTSDLVEALATIRNQPGRTTEEALSNILEAFEVLDNAGIFSAIDQAVGKCTCPPSYAANDYHEPNCPEAPTPARTGDCKCSKGELFREHLMGCPATTKTTSGPTWDDVLFRKEN